MGYCLSHAPPRRCLATIAAAAQRWRHLGRCFGVGRWWLHQLGVIKNISLSLSYGFQKKYTWTILNVTSMTWHHTNNVTCWNSIQVIMMMIEAPPEHLRILQMNFWDPLRLVFLGVHFNGAYLPHFANYMPIHVLLNTYHQDAYSTYLYNSYAINMHDIY